MTCKLNLSVEVLKSNLSYDASTGDFFWLKNKPRGVLAGDKAGCLTNYGYRSICIGGQRFLAHRLAWLYVYGAIPTMFLDHINGIRTDNRICNLRQISATGNAQNQKIKPKKTASGHIGVIRSGNRWRATIFVDKKKHCLGCFGTVEEAHAAYLNAKKEMHTSWVP